MLDSLAMLGGKAELGRLCPVIQEHMAGLQDGHSGTWVTCVSHVFLLKSPDTTEPPPYLLLFAALLPAPLPGTQQG